MKRNGGLIPGRPNIIQCEIQHHLWRDNSRITLGMSWCSLRDSRWALNSLTRSLCVLFANLATRSASWSINVRRMATCGGINDGRRTRRFWISSNRFSASVFLEELPSVAGEFLPLLEGVLLASSSWNKSSFTRSRSRSLSESCLDLDFFFFLRV